MAIFAGLALLLAAVGIYGVTSYTVSQRTQEIGLRMALGAQTHAVRRMILSQTLKVTLIGVTARKRLGVAVLLIAVALPASYIRVRCAMRVDPLVALRYE